MTRQDSIRVIGLEKHLDASRSLHNDRGYDELVKYIKTFEDMGEPLPMMKIARAFKVSRTTLEKWLTIYDEESRDK